MLLRLAMSDHMLLHAFTFDYKLLDILYELCLFMHY